MSPLRTLCACSFRRGTKMSVRAHIFACGIISLYPTSSFALRIKKLEAGRTLRPHTLRACAFSARRKNVRASTHFCLRDNTALPDVFVCFANKKLEMEGAWRLHALRACAFSARRKNVRRVTHFCLRDGFCIFDPIFLNFFFDLIIPYFSLKYFCFFDFQKNGHMFIGLIMHAIVSRSNHAICVNVPQRFMAYCLLIYFTVFSAFH